MGESGDLGHDVEPGMMQCSSCLKDSQHGFDASSVAVCPVTQRVEIFSQLLTAAEFSLNITHLRAQAADGNNSNGTVSNLATSKGYSLLECTSPASTLYPKMAYATRSSNKCQQADGPQKSVPDAPKPMQHYVNDDIIDIFRLPVTWDFLVSAPGQPQPCGPG